MLTDSGGVAYMMGASGFAINESEIYYNTAAKSGGVVYADYDTSLAFFGSFVWNNSAQHGGVIAVLESSKTTYHRENTQKRPSSVTILDSYFESNFANYCGGVGSIEYTNDMSIIRSKFMKILAHFCGGVFETGIVIMTMEDVEIVNNHAPEGGAIKLFQSIVSFYGVCSLIENSAILGGAILAAESILSFIHVNTLAENNTAFEGGGGLYLDYSKVYCKHNSTVKFIGNIAARRGGGVHENSEGLSSATNPKPKG